MPLSVLKSAAVTSAAASAAIPCNSAGFLPGQVVMAHVGGTNGADFVGTVVIQTSDDGTTWGTADGATSFAVTTGTGRSTTQFVTLKSFIRLNCTAFTSGTVQMQLVSTL